MCKKGAPLTVIIPSGGEGSSPACLQQVLQQAAIPTHFACLVSDQALHIAEQFFPCIGVTQLISQR